MTVLPKGRNKDDCAAKRNKDDLWSCDGTVITTKRNKDYFADKRNKDDCASLMAQLSRPANQNWPRPYPTSLLMPLVTSSPWSLLWQSLPRHRVFKLAITTTLQTQYIISVSTSSLHYLLRTTHLQLHEDRTTALLQLKPHFSVTWKHQK